jgi:hypothetical protein
MNVIPSDEKSDERGNPNVYHPLNYKKKTILCRDFTWNRYHLESFVIV